MLDDSLGLELVVDDQGREEELSGGLVLEGPPLEDGPRVYGEVLGLVWDDVVVPLVLADKNLEYFASSWTCLSAFVAW